MPSSNGAEEPNSRTSAKWVLPSHLPKKGADIASQLTDQFEGTVIRVFRRLQELIRQMTAAAKAIGNTDLEQKFMRALEMLGRQNSVIFCSSLYL